MKNTYDATGHLLTKEVGILEVATTTANTDPNGGSGDPFYNDPYYMEMYSHSADPYGSGGSTTTFSDVNQPEYAIYHWEYYPTGHPNKGLLKTEFGLLWDGSSADTHRTDYEYNGAGNITKKLGSASVAGQQRPETNYAYNALARLSSVVDPEGHTTTFEYDGRGRRIRTIYDDGSNEETLYGAAGSGFEGLVVKTKDRRNVVTSITYDLSDRVIQTITGSAFDSNILDGQPDDTPITDRNEQSISQMAYEPGNQRPTVIVRDGARTDLVFDYRGRVIESVVYPYAGKSLSSKTTYVRNRKLYDEDPYGRRKYQAYRASDGVMVRYVTEAYPGVVSGVMAANDNTADYTAGYEAGYPAGYEAGFQDPYYMYSGGGAAPTPTGSAAYVKGFLDGYGDGGGDGAGDGFDVYYGSMYGSGGGGYHGTYWLGHYHFSFLVPPVDQNAVLMALMRDTNLNPDYTVKDAIQDPGGHVWQVVDERGTASETTHDSRGQTTVQLAAKGTPVEAKTETLYDAGGNAIEIRSPRYFDANDPNGNEKSRTVMTYDGAGRVLTRTEAPGTAEVGAESYTYDLAGRQKTRTDARGKIWTTNYASCCGHSVSSRNPLGHGSISNQNAGGLTVHTAGIADVDTHSSLLNPVDAKTLQETTTKYDALGRSTASTVWLQPLGLVDVAAPPIAGLGGIAGTDGLTTQTLYDADLTDNVGLETGGGISATNPEGGTYTVSLSAAIAKLGEPITQGGAGITFAAGTPGTAAVNINAENEVSFSISDAQGRSLMSGMLSVEQASSLLTWSCNVPDTVETIDSKVYLCSLSVDALGNTTKSRSNGLGHTLQSVDQGGFISTVQYDAGGNAVISRDPNNVGYDVVYDAIGRSTSRTDSDGSVTQSVFDKAGQQITATDAKGNATVHQFDARGRRMLTTNRIGGTAQFTYDAAGNQLSVTDAELQVTAYEYDDRGLKVKTVYPDHIPGSAVGTDGYGVTKCSYDALGRRNVCTDQAGDTRTYNCDLAGRLLSCDYRTAPNSPAGGIADTDSYAYDRQSRVLTATSGRSNNARAITYDSAGRTSTESLTVAGHTYTTALDYDNVGRQAQITYPNGKVLNRTYTDRHQLEQLTYDGSVVDTRSYDNGMRLQITTLGNGITETREYNPDNTLVNISFSNANIGTYSYTWDANKNKTSETITGALAAYSFTTGANGYDAEDRLTSYTRGSLNQQWGLSLEGDWNTFAENGVVQNRTHGPAHELRAVGSQTTTLDTKGNLTSKPSALNATETSTLVWDFDNQLKSVDTDSDGTPDVTYSYDALGRRTTKNNTVFVCLGQQVIAEYTSGASAESPAEQYVYGNYIDEPIIKDGTGGITYYHRNHQYSIVGLTDAAGSVVEHYAYDAFGDVEIMDASLSPLAVGVAGNTYSYTGRRYEPETGDYFFRARYYDSELGRFLARDPLQYVEGWSMYRGYFGLRGADPLGGESIDLSDGNNYCKTFASSSCIFEYCAHKARHFGHFDLRITFQFPSDSREAKCCKETKFVQIGKATDPFGKIIWDWHLDGAKGNSQRPADPPFWNGNGLDYDWHDGESTHRAMVCGSSSKPAELYDQPGHRRDNVRIDLVTCAMCTKGYMAGEWLGCLQSWVRTSGDWSTVYETGVSDLAEPPKIFNDIMSNYKKTLDSIKDSGDDCCSDGQGYYYNIGDPQYQ